MVQILVTYLDGEAWRQAQGDEVTQLGEVGVGDGHEVDDGRHLLRQRQRVALAQPQSRLKPDQETAQINAKIGEEPQTHANGVSTATSYFWTLLVSSTGRPMSRPFRSNSALKYSSAVMAVGL